jgi:AraC family transcriptional regulator
MKATVFPFESRSGKGSSVTLAALRDLPPCDGASQTFDGHAIAVHLGRPLRVRQRREDLSQEVTYGPGDLTVIPAGWQSACWTDQSSDRLIHVELSRGLVNDTTEGLTGLGPGPAEMPCLFRFEDALCRELALSMLAEAEAHGPGARMYVESAAAVLALRLLRMGGASIRAAGSRSGLPDVILRRAKEYLHEQMSRNPGVAELAAAVGMNVHHFSRMFKRSTGLAPHQYLNDVRLERAKQLLADGRTTIIEIGYETGFASPSQFSAFFRKRTGLTPSQYRRAVSAGR